MDPTSLGTLAPPLGALPDSPYVVKVVNSAYYLDEDPPQGSGQRLDYAFGAGKHGMTYIGLEPDNHLFEMRASYFPGVRQWRPTPGLESMPPVGMGLIYSEENSRNCFRCHVTTLPAHALTPEPRFLGVGCEACHGPANAHVTAMQSPSSGEELHIARISSWGAKRIDTLCATCHQNTLTKSNPTQMTRFQPNDVERSRCFKESNNTLSCTTCHNPHQNTSHDRRAYEAICLRCHSAPASGAPSTQNPARSAGSHTGATVDQGTPSSASPVVKGKVCPVNAQSGCIPCHMPTREVLPDTLTHSMAPDHYIRVFPTQQKSVTGK